MRGLILAAALAAASTSFALTPASADYMGGVPNAGIMSLGVDISAVPDTHAGVAAFLATLEPQTRRAVEDACANYNTRLGGLGKDRDTLAFCAVAPRA